MGSGAEVGEPPSACGISPRFAGGESWGDGRCAFAYEPERGDFIRRVAMSRSWVLPSASIT